MTIGSGRILYQDLVKINLASEDGSLASNSALDDTIQDSTIVHLIGLLSDGGVHSHISHTISLATILQNAGKRVYLHLITDGRDVSPKSAVQYIEQIEAICNKDISIATISGRYYTMDRDNRWERVELGYNAIANATPATTQTHQQYIQESYDNALTDEFMLPVAFGDYKGMQNGDSVIITNFRSDRVREITQALGDKEFSGFHRERISLRIATMTKYDDNFKYPVMFPKIAPENTLSQVISNANLTQFHTAETEKYAHVTFFFNGGTEEPAQGEDRVLIPSPDVATYDLKPEMSAAQVTQAVTGAMEKSYDFIVVNFANGDMVGHTGNYEAACLAVNTVDTQLDKIITKAQQLDYDILLTSDHGNCEEMKDIDGNILTNHTVGDVWCYVISDKVTKLNSGGGLNNIAPTILKLMNLEIPPQMDKPLF